MGEATGGVDIADGHRGVEGLEVPLRLRTEPPQQIDVGRGIEAEAREHLGDIETGRLWPRPGLRVLAIQHHGSCYPKAVYNAGAR